MCPWSHKCQQDVRKIDRDNRMSERQKHRPTFRQTDRQKDRKTERQIENRKTFQLSYQNKSC